MAAIATVLAVHGPRAERAPGSPSDPAPPSGSAEARTDFLRGQYLLHGGTAERLSSAIQYFSDAIAKDPGYSAAYAGLAQANIAIANYRTPRAVLPLAKASAERAVQLSADQPETHLALADVSLYYDWEWARAEREYRRAIELAPELPAAHYGYADFLEASRRFPEMLREVRRGLDLERAQTADATAFAVREQAKLAWAYSAARDYPQAILHASRALELDPASGARTTLVAAEIATGDFVGATAELDRIRAQSNGQLPENAFLGRAYAMVGRREEATQILQTLQERSLHQYVPQDQLGTLYLGLGDTARAIGAFERAIDDHHWFVVHLNSAVMFEPLRTKPQFQRLLARVHAPE